MLGRGVLLHPPELRHVEVLPGLLAGGGILTRAPGTLDQLAKHPKRGARNLRAHATKAGAALPPRPFMSHGYPDGDASQPEPPPRPARAGVRHSWSGSLLVATLLRARRARRPCCGRELGHPGGAVAGPGRRGPARRRHLRRRLSARRGARTRHRGEPDRRDRDGLRHLPLRRIGDDGPVRCRPADGNRPARPAASRSRGRRAWAGPTTSTSTARPTGGRLPAGASRPSPIRRRPSVSMRSGRRTGDRPTELTVPVASARATTSPACSRWRSAPTGRPSAPGSRSGPRRPGRSGRATATETLWVKVRNGVGLESAPSPRHRSRSTPTRRSVVAIAPAPGAIVVGLRPTFTVDIQRADGPADLGRLRTDRAGATGIARLGSVRLRPRRPKRDLHPRPAPRAGHGLHRDHR